MKKICIMSIWSFLVRQTVIYENKSYSNSILAVFNNGMSVMYILIAICFNTSVVGEILKRALQIHYLFQYYFMQTGYLCDRVNTRHYDIDFLVIHPCLIHLCCYLTQVNCYLFCPAIYKSDVNSSFVFKVSSFCSLPPQCFLSANNLSL